MMHNIESVALRIPTLSSMLLVVQVPLVFAFDYMYKQKNLGATGVNCSTLILIISPDSYSYQAPPTLLEMH